MRKTTVSLSDEVHKKVRMYCAEHDKQINKLFQEAITEKMEQTKHD